MWDYARTLDEIVNVLDETSKEQRGGTDKYALPKLGLRAINEV